jgi:uroporphyrinogen-III synthase
MQPEGDTGCTPYYDDAGVPVLAPPVSLEEVPEPPPSAGGPQHVWIPLIRLEPVQGSSKAFLDALESSGGRVAVVATSPRSPRILALDAAALGLYCRLLEAVRSRSAVGVASGPSTAGALKRYLGVADVIEPPEPGVEGAARILSSLQPLDAAIVLRASEPSRSYRALIEAAVKAAERVYEVTVYVNLPLEANAEAAAALALQGLVDVVALSSPLQASLLAERLGGEPRAAVAAIGRPTAEEAERRGLRVDAVAPRPGMRELVETAVSLCRRREAR